MPLTIDHLDVHCRAAPERRELASDLEHWTRQSLGTALGPHLGPSPDRLSGIHLIRRLEVRLRLTARDWNEGRFLAAACRAFSEALFRTLAQPASADSGERAHYEDEVAWRASLIRWLITPDRQQAWHFDLVEAPQSGNARSATLLLMLEDPATLPELLRSLSLGGTLTHLAALWDDIELEQIFLALSRGRAEQGTVHDLDEALRVLRLSLKVGPPAARGFASRQHALLVYAANTLPFVSARTTFHLLQAVRSIVEYPSRLSFTREEFSLDSKVRPAVADWRAIFEAASGAAEWEALRAELARRLPAVPRDQAQAEREWIRSNYAGLFLLAPMAFILNWHSTSGLAHRVFPGVLAGVLQSAIGEFDTEEPVLDPAASLAAGLGLDPSFRDVRTLLAGVEVSALAQRWQIESAGDASIFFTQATHRLLCELGSRIRGFRHASPEAIARAFVRIPGRMQVTGEHLRVVLDPMPYGVALHISGCDGEQPRLPWLNPLTVSLLLEGL